MTIKPVDDQTLGEAIELVNRVFSKYVAPGYGEEGQKTFNDYLKEKPFKLKRDIDSGDKKMWCAYDEQGGMSGVFATRGKSHISLLFVDEQHQRRGVASALFEHFLNDLYSGGYTGAVTVNSSPYAKGIYERLGFHATGEQTEKNGIIFIPMEYPAPDSAK